ncbi:endonuclease/exonuclease/phosphatase family protein [Brevundimonas bacteroides]|uniref:endonuclease/exonuclease/phosphatase family protein n=1 Tax=Brevundimonas bacteroides TaxID=74311 RepID=UPI0004976C62|nr:endonuclease/exonuclease/phosphatase family protein [Brevundimonas bacteroides]
MTLASRPRLRWFLTACVALLSGGPLVIAVASLSGHGHRWVDILAQFVGPALVAATALFGLAVLLRSRSAGIATGLVLVLVGVAGSPQWFPARGWASEEADFTLYFANLFVGNGDADGIGRSIREAQPDIVVLVEVGDEARPALDAILSEFPHRVVTPRRPGGAGPSVSVIASRWPLAERPIDLMHAFAVAAEADTPSGPVTVAGVHLTRPWPYQYQWAQIIQTQELIAWRSGISGPLVLAGDFNSVSSARIGRMIRSEAGLIAAPGWPGTWPSFLPAWAGMTIDHVYRTPDLALTQRRIGRDNGSDHRPVIVRLVRSAETPAA